MYVSTGAMNPGKLCQFISVRIWPEGFIMDGDVESRRG